MDGELQAGLLALGGSAALCWRLSSCRKGACRFQDVYHAAELWKAFQRSAEDSPPISASKTAPCQVPGSRALKCLQDKSCSGF